MRRGHKHGQNTRRNRHVRQQRDAEMMVVAFFGLNAVQRTPGAVRCTAPSWTSKVRVLELAACQSAQAIIQMLIIAQNKSHNLGTQKITTISDLLFLFSDSDNNSLACWRSVDLVITSRRNDVLQYLNGVTCGHCSNSRAEKFTFHDSLQYRRRVSP